MDHRDVNAEQKAYSRIYRWLGLAIDFLSNSEDEEDQKAVEIMRKEPFEILEGLVEIRMALIAYKMSNVTHSGEESHLVKRNEFESFIKEFPPTSKDKWWPMWIRYIRQMDELEWRNMWIALDLTVEDILKGR